MSFHRSCVVLLLLTLSAMTTVLQAAGANPCEWECDEPVNFEIIPDEDFSICEGDAVTGGGFTIVPTSGDAVYVKVGDGCSGTKTETKDHPGYKTTFDEYPHEIVHRFWWLNDYDANDCITTGEEVTQTITVIPLDCYKEGSAQFVDPQGGGEIVCYDPQTGQASHSVSVGIDISPHLLGCMGEDRGEDGTTDADASWEIRPAQGVTSATQGDGTTASFTFDKPGDYSVHFTLLDKSADQEYCGGPLEDVITISFRVVENALELMHEASYGLTAEDAVPVCYDSIIEMRAQREERQPVVEMEVDCKEPRVRDYDGLFRDDITWTATNADPASGAGLVALFHALEPGTCDVFWVGKVTDLGIGTVYHKASHVPGDSTAHSSIRVLRLKDVAFVECDKLQYSSYTKNVREITSVVEGGSADRIYTLYRRLPPDGPGNYNWEQVDEQVGQDSVTFQIPEPGVYYSAVQIEDVAGGECFGVTAPFTHYEIKVEPGNPKLDYDYGDTDVYTSPIDEFREWMAKNVTTAREDLKSAQEGIKASASAINSSNETVLSKLNQDIDNLEDEVESHARQEQDLDQQVKAQQDLVDDVSAQLADKEARLAQVQSDLVYNQCTRGSQKSICKNLYNTYDQLSESIASTKTRLSGLTANLDNLKKDWAAMKSALTKLKNARTQIAGRLAAYKNTMKSVVKTADLAQAATDVKKLGTDLTKDFRSLPLLKSVSIVIAGVEAVEFDTKAKEFDGKMAAIEERRVALNRIAEGMKDRLDNLRLGRPRPEKQFQEVKVTSVPGGIEYMVTSENANDWQTQDDSMPIPREYYTTFNYHVFLNDVYSGLNPAGDPGFDRWKSTNSAGVSVERFYNYGNLGRGEGCFYSKECDEENGQVFESWSSRSFGATEEEMMALVALAEADVKAEKEAIDLVLDLASSALSAVASILSAIALFVGFATGIAEALTVIAAVVGAISYFYTSETPLERQVKEQFPTELPLVQQ